MREKSAVRELSLPRELANRLVTLSRADISQVGALQRFFAAASTQPMLLLHLINCWLQWHMFQTFFCHGNSILLLIKNEVALFESFRLWLPWWLVGAEAKLCRLGWQRWEGRRQGKGSWGTWCFYFPFWCLISFCLFWRLAIFNGRKSNHCFLLCLSVSYKIADCWTKYQR